METIMLSAPYMIPEMKEIWREGFPQDSEYVEFFFKEYYKPECAAVIIGESGMETVGYRLPARINTGIGKDKQLPVYMCLAGTTRKEFRGKGNIVKIMDFFAADAAKNGYCGIIGSLLMSSREIHKKHNAMPPNVFIRESVFENNSFTKGDILNSVPCPQKIFVKLRRDYIDKRIYSIYWLENELEFLMKDIRLNGEVLLLNEKHYAVVSDFGKNVLVRETDYPKDRLCDIVKTVSSLYPAAEKITVQTPQGEDIDASDCVSSEIVYSASMRVFEEYKGAIPFHSEPMGNMPFPYFNITAN